MKQFKLCLLAVLMLFVSNCVTEYAVGTTEVHSHYDTPQSAIKNKHKRMLHSHTIQRYSLGTQAKVMSGKQGELGNIAQQKPGEANKKTEQDSTSDQNGNNGDNRDTQTEQHKPRDDLSNSNTVPVDKTAPALLPGQTEGNPTETRPAPGAKSGEEEDSGKTSAGQKPKKEDNSAPDVSATESTTTEPAAEGDRTDGSSDPMSTTTHSPTETVKGSDSQASVKAGAVSFILTISTVLAIIM